MVHLAASDDIVVNGLVETIDFVDWTEQELHYYKLWHAGDMTPATIRYYPVTLQNFYK